MCTHVTSVTYLFFYFPFCTNTNNATHTAGTRRYTHNTCAIAEHLPLLVVLYKTAVPNFKRMRSLYRVVVRRCARTNGRFFDANFSFHVTRRQNCLKRLVRGETWVHNVLYCKLTVTRCRENVTFGDTRRHAAWTFTHTQTTHTRLQFAHTHIYETSILRVYG